MAEVKTVSTLLTPSTFTFPETPPLSFLDPNIVTGTGTYSGFTGYSYPFTASRNNPSQNFYRISNFESTPVSPLYDRPIYGTYAFDPKLYKELVRMGKIHPTITYGNYSMFGKDGVNPEGYILSQIDDFKQSGAIRGTSQFQGNAFFNRGFPDEQYRATHQFGNSPNGRNAYIEITPEFINKVKSGANPLYTGFESAMASGQYQTLNPRQTYNVKWNEIPNGVVDYPTSFLDRINPANRQGVRVVVTNPAELSWHDTVQRFSNRPNSVGQVVGRNSSGQYIIPEGQYSSPYYTSNPNTRVLYDTITPIEERTLGQHWRNLQWNIDTILSQPEVKPYWSLAKKGANLTLKGAGVLAYAGGIAHNGPVQTAIEYGVPFTPLKYGVGPVLPANAPEIDPYIFERQNDPMFGLSPEERLQRQRTEKQLRDYDSQFTLTDDIKNFTLSK